MNYCKHEWRPTTNEFGETDGVICIYCLEYRSFKDRMLGKIYAKEHT